MSLAGGNERHRPCSPVPTATPGPVLAGHARSVPSQCQAAPDELDRSRTEANIDNRKNRPVSCGNSGPCPLVTGREQRLRGATGEAIADRVASTELGDRAEDLEEHPADRVAGVDALIEDHQVHALSLQLLG